MIPSKHRAIYQTILTMLISQELLAHNRTLEEMVGLIKCDSLIFQTLDDLKAACLEAADEGCRVTGFEVGVFCGEYRTPVPVDYLERWSERHETKKRKSEALTREEGTDVTTVVASSGPVNGPIPQHDTASTQSLEHHEDIRYAYPRTAAAARWCWTTNASTVFTTTLQVAIRCRQRVQTLIGGDDCVPSHQEHRLCKPKIMYIYGNQHARLGGAS